MLKVADISRLRIKTDGDGIRTLVLLRGCPLRCRYCINPGLRSGKGDARNLSARQLYEEIFPDRPYFMATGGGVTFGGGEPLFFVKDIAAFRALTEDAFTVFAETSLHVPERMVRAAAGSVDRFYVDIKTTDEEKYRAYTQGRLKTVLRNLELLLSEAGSERDRQTSEEP